MLDLPRTQVASSVKVHRDRLRRHAAWMSWPSIVRQPLSQAVNPRLVGGTGLRTRGCSSIPSRKRGSIRNGSRIPLLFPASICAGSRFLSRYLDPRTMEATGQVRFVFPLPMDREIQARLRLPSRMESASPSGELLPLRMEPRNRAARWIHSRWKRVRDQLRAVRTSGAACRAGFPDSLTRKPGTRWHIPRRPSQYSMYSSHQNLRRETGSLRDLGH